MYNKSRQRLIVYAMTVFQQCMALLEPLSRWQKNQEDLTAYSSEIVQKIVEILQSYQSRVPNERPISAIVFVRERHIAYFLSVGSFCRSLEFSSQQRSFENFYFLLTTASQPFQIPRRQAFKHFFNTPTSTLKD